MLFGAAMRCAARFLPVGARFAPGRLEVLGIEGEVGIDVLLRPGLRPGVHGVEHLGIRRTCRPALAPPASRRPAPAPAWARWRRPRRAALGAGVRRRRRAAGVALATVGACRPRRTAPVLPPPISSRISASLFLRAGVGGVELQRLVVGLAGELGVDVAEVLVARWRSSDACGSTLQRAARLFVLALRGVDHGEIVVGLGQLGVVLRQLAGTPRWRPSALPCSARISPFRKRACASRGLAAR